MGLHTNSGAELGGREIFRLSPSPAATGTGVITPSGPTLTPVAHLEYRVLVLEDRIMHAEAELARLRAIFERPAFWRRWWLALRSRFA